MKGLKLLFIVIFAIETIKGETGLVEGDGDGDGESTIVLDEAEVVEEEPPYPSESYDYNEGDDVQGRLLKTIQVYANDERCNAKAVCRDMNFGNKDVVATFERTPRIRLTSASTYKVIPSNNYLSFVNSKFAHFPLQLFHAFQLRELDFRNCSLETLKWNNFIGADHLTILLLSENRLTKLEPMLFGYAENLSFLFLDGNRISILYNDSFRGLERLNFLDLHDNLIESLPAQIFSYLPSIQQLNLAENRIKVIAEALFANNPQLFTIHLQQNDLKEIEEYAFRSQDLIKYLDISHNTDLQVLACANIKVENLWARNCSLNRVNIYGEALYVDLEKNCIKELYFSKPESLETLRLKDNALEQISSLSLTINLRILDVSHNPHLKTLPDMWKIQSLERLDLSNTSLKQIPITILNSPSKLRSLNVSFNQLEEIDPLNFKYLEKLSQFYIHHNNWNCFNLHLLMDMIMQRFRITYTHDEYDEEFPGEYIHGIKCMYRFQLTDKALNVEIGSQSLNNLAEDTVKVQEYNQLNFATTKELEKLRREVKTIVGINEQKFDMVLDKLTDIDMRLKKFEHFNESLWQSVSLVV